MISCKYTDAETGDNVEVFWEPPEVFLGTASTTGSDLWQYSNGNVSVMGPLWHLYWNEAPLKRVGADWLLLESLSPAWVHPVLFPPL